MEVAYFVFTNGTGRVVCGSYIARPCPFRPSECVWIVPGTITE